jgi:hypothetical protein
MSLSQSSQSGATMLFFWSYFPLFITIFLFLKKKQEGFSFLSGLETSIFWVLAIDLNKLKI